MTAPRPYQVCLYVGPSAPALPDVRVVDLTPEQPTAAAVLERLRASDLNPADLRSRVLFVVDGGEAYRDAALLTYSALLGFAKRRLDVSFGADSEAFVIADFDKSLRSEKDAGRPEVAVPQVQVGGPERTDLPCVTITRGFTPEKVSLIRYARRIRFVPPAPLLDSLLQLVALAALRARGESDKLPYLCSGDEPAATDETLNDVVGICLDTLRRDAEEVRRSLRSDNRDSLAEKVEPTSRLLRLLEADAAAVTDTLTRLGAKSKTIEVDPKPGTPEFEAGEKLLQEVWHCPRPERHTNGDATPSARVNAKSGAFQCFRCDRERVTSLRLVMDTKSLSADEAADWILTPSA